MDKSSQGIDFGGCPAFLDSEIDYWLDTAMYQLISTKLTGNNSLKLPFEGAVKRIHDLEKLVVTDDIKDIAPENNTNKIVIEDVFPGTGNTKRMFYVSSILTFDTKKKNDKGEEVNVSHNAIVKLISHEHANAFIKTYNNDPWIENPVAIIQDNNLIIYYDYHSMLSNKYGVTLTYIKFPTKVEDLGDTEMTEFPENVQMEIVNRAVELALENIESKREQSKLQLNQIEE